MILGCAEPESATVKLKPPPGVILAEDAAGIWNQDQVRMYIQDELDLSSVQLQSKAGGSYDAVGSTADGRQYEISIEQKPGGIRYSWTRADGGSGSGAFGTFVEP